MIMFKTYHSANIVADSTRYFHNALIEVLRLLKFPFLLIKDSVYCLYPLQNLSFVHSEEWVFKRLFLSYSLCIVKNRK